MTEINNKTKDIKLYSSRAISGATFLGGPLAAGFLIGENFKSLNKPIVGRNSLIIGITTTILLFIGIFMIPEQIIDKMPKQLIPLIYTGIIWGIVEWKLGDVLKAHKENGNSFFSGWRAAGIALISLIIILVGIFGYTFLSTNDEVYEQYDIQLSLFTENETESLIFYEHLDTKPNFVLINELDKDVIPKWKENLQIIEQTNQIEGLPAELIKQNEILLKYCELRIKGFELFRKAISENTDKYSLELDKVHSEIDEILKKLN